MFLHMLCHFIRRVTHLILRCEPFHVRDFRIDNEGTDVAGQHTIGDVTCLPVKWERGHIHFTRRVHESRVAPANDSVM